MTDARRKAVALLALAGTFLSLYLVLHRLGYYGTLQCGAGGSCEFVQASRWAVFLGIPVAAWGLGWYVAVFAAALVSLRGGGNGGERRSVWPDRALAVLAAGGLAFTAYLKSIELFVLEAICRWCVGSAVLVLLIFIAVWPAFRSRRGARAAAVEGEAPSSA